MTIYIASGDITDVVNITTGSNVVDTTTTAAKDANFVNCSMNFNATREGNVQIGSTQSDLWFHFVFYQSNSSVPGGANDIVRFSNGSSSEYRLRATPTTNFTSLALEKTTNGTTWTAISTINFNTVLLGKYTFDIRLKPHATTGVAIVCVNGVQVMSFSGDTSTQTNLMDRIVLTGATGVAGNFSELIITDGATPTMAWRAQSILPNGAGTYSEFTGASTAIDEIQIDLADFIISNTVNQRFTANYVDATTTQLASMEIKGVVSVSTASLSTDSTPTDLQHFLRSNSSDFTTANLGHSRDGVVRTKFTVYETNPATSAKFTLVEAAALQLGVKAV